MVEEYHNGIWCKCYILYSEIFQANNDQSIIKWWWYILQGTLSNGIKLESNTLVVGSVKTTPLILMLGH